MPLSPGFPVPSPGPPDADIPEQIARDSEVAASIAALSDAFVSWPAFTAVAGGVGFENSWTNFGAPFAAASFRKSSDGTQLQLTGTIVGGTNAVAAFTLPSGYRPTTRKDIALWNSDSGTFISTIIGTDGQVVPTGGSLTRIHLDVVIQLTL